MKTSTICYTLILLFFIGGCTYSITIEKDRNYINSNSKNAYKSFYVNDNFMMKDTFNYHTEGFLFKIEFGANLSENIYKLLKSHFENIDKNQTEETIFKFEPDINLNCDNSFCYSEFDLKITDLNKNVIIKQYTFKDKIDVSTGSLDNSMMFLSGLTLCLLCPITIPVAGQSRQGRIKENWENYIDAVTYKLHLKLNTDKFFYERYLKNNYPSMFKLMGNEKPVTM